MAPRRRRRLRRRGARRRRRRRRGRGGGGARRLRATTRAAERGGVSRASANGRGDGARDGAVAGERRRGLRRLDDDDDDDEEAMASRMRPTRTTRRDDDDDYARPEEEEAHGTHASAASRRRAFESDDEVLEVSQMPNGRGRRRRQPTMTTTTTTSTTTSVPPPPAPSRAARGARSSAVACACGGGATAAVGTIDALLLKKGRRGARVPITATASSTSMASSGYDLDFNASSAAPICGPCESARSIDADTTTTSRILFDGDDDSIATSRPRRSLAPAACLARAPECVAPGVRRVGRRGGGGCGGGGVGEPSTSASRKVAAAPPPAPPWLGRNRTSPKLVLQRRARLTVAPCLCWSSSREDTAVDVAVHDVPSTHTPRRPLMQHNARRWACTESSVAGGAVVQRRQPAAAADSRGALSGGASTSSRRAATCALAHGGAAGMRKIPPARGAPSPAGRAARGGFASPCTTPMPPRLLLGIIDRLAAWLLRIETSKSASTKLGFDRLPPTASAASTVFGASSRFGVLAFAGSRARRAQSRRLQRRVARCRAPSPPRRARRSLAAAHVDAPALHSTSGSSSSPCLGRRASRAGASARMGRLTSGVAACARGGVGMAI